MINKSLSAALAISSTLLPMGAFARNDNDGSTGANAVTTVLIDDDELPYTLILHTYNKMGDVLEFHGDVELVLKPNTDPDKRTRSFQEFGFCMETKNSDSNWDCMSIQTNLVPSKIADDVDGTYGSEFKLIDGWFNPKDFYLKDGDDFG